MGGGEGKENNLMGKGGRGDGGLPGAKQDGRQQWIITKFKENLQGYTHVRMEKVCGGGDAEANIMWHETLIYSGVIHAVNYMHVLLSCTKACV